MTIGVPTDEAGHREAVVLFLSKRERDVILLGLPSEKLASVVGLNSVFEHVQALVYTTREPIDKGVWPVLRVLDVDESLIELSHRQDVTGAWRGDERLEHTGAPESLPFPQLAVAGEGVVRNVARQLHEGNPSKFTTKVIKNTARLYGYLQARS